MKKILLFILSITFLVSTNSCVKDVVDTAGTIYGIVNDSDNGEPVPNASVIITPGGKSTNTGSDGHYEFVDMEPGQYTVQIMKSGFKTNTKRISVVAGEKAVGDMLLSKGASMLKLSLTSLNFGTQYSSLSFSIMNVGTSGKINWNISNVPSWMSVVNTSGSVDQGKESAVVVTVNRDQIKETSTANLIISGNGESLSLAVTVEVGINDAAMELSKSSLDFGALENSLSFDVTNKGTNGNLDWTVSTPKSPAISVSPSTASTAAGKSTSVVVTLDRSKMTTAIDETLQVKSEGESKTIRVTAALADPSGAEVESCDSKIAIKVTTCSRSGKNLLIEYTVCNTGYNGEFRNWGILATDLRDKSLFTDDLSNIYKYASGASENEVELYVAKNYLGTTSLVKDVPVKCSITLKNFNSSAKSVTCKVPCYSVSPNLEQLYFVLKNVPVK